MAFSAAVAATGAALLFSGRSAWGQALLLVHVACGVLALAWLGRYLLAHGRRQWAVERGTARLLAAAAALLVAASAVTGLAAAAVYAFGLVGAFGLGDVHALTSACVLVLVPVHLAMARPADGAASKWRSASVLAGAAALVLAVLVAASPALRRDALLPADADYPRSAGGGLFDAAFTRTVHDGFVAPWAIASSEACAPCHAEIYEEWTSSVHRFSGIDNPLIAAATRAAENGGGLAAARFCAACHEPVPLLAGAVRTSNFDVADGLLGHGVTCQVCHGVGEVGTLRGNGEMVYRPPELAAFVGADGALARAAGNVLVAGFREEHAAAMRPPLLSNSHQCSSCHTVNAHEGLNGRGFVRLHNENDDWRVSAFAAGVGADGRVVRCQDCHMPLVSPSRDPAAAKRGRGHRSHRFPAANTFIAEHFGGPEQLRITEAFLRGELEMTELDGLVPPGPPVAVTIEAPPVVAAGGAFDVAVVVENRGVGHAFPAGPIEVHEAWLEVRAVGEGGRVLLDSGWLTAEGRRDPDAFALRAVPVGASGEEVFATAGLSFGFSLRRAIASGAADRERYTVAVPAELAGTAIQVRARLRYRKADPEFMDLVEGFGIEDVRVTDLSEAEASVAVTQAGLGAGRGG